MLAGFHGAMRFGGLLERIDAMDQRRDAPSSEVRHDVALECVDDRGFLLDGARPQHGPQDAQAVHQHAADVELGLAAAHDADHREPPADGERAHVLREVRAAQVVEDDVDAALIGVALHGVGEILFLVVDDDVGAERFDALDLARRRRDEHARARRERLHDLHRRRRDAAAAAVQQHRLAVGEPGVEKQVHEGRQVRLADAGRLLEAHALRNAHDVPGMRDGGSA